MLWIMKSRILTIEPPKGISLEDAKIALKSLEFKIIEQSEAVIEDNKLSKTQEKEIMQISKSIKRNGTKKWFNRKRL